MKKNLSIVLSAVTLTGWMACQEQPGVPSSTAPAKTTQGTAKIVATAAPAWSDMLLQDSGWIGADGIYCVPMDGVETAGSAAGKQTLFWFSDNIVGKVQGDTLHHEWGMAHNSIAFMDGDEPGKGKMNFYLHTDAQGQPLSIFEPNTPQTKPGDYYWLGDGFFNHALDSTIYIFGYRIMNIPDGGIYPFDDVGLTLIALPKGSKPPFKEQRQLDCPFFAKDSRGRGKLVFGSCVLANTRAAGAPKPDGFIYVYGVRGPFKELVVARVADSLFEKFGEWRFWDGKNWQPDMHNCAALANRVSNEMSVSFMEDGRVIAAYQLDGDSPDIVIRAGRTPAGPFEPVRKVWSTPEIYEDIDYYTYNAKAHPHLSRPGELLISYNVNSFDFAADIVQHPHHLRPRFFTVTYR
ncbi:MAG: DUF4185 domain-containing protein [Candidatus Pseudobacter hemicellulosilyticus]|uniref:DUF4185 domain-containing protein n=1 Tax=Candidatus Pseudobacter hemicellulosilyticus TaxID=3121375 RepID=A0AAJ5WQI6_9BACT|nr:MAG: DUF4185 domain-containing protein [Pseudobacter sp.]